jgi:bacteriophage CI repressor helix-turn-helix domain
MKFMLGGKRVDIGGKIKKSRTDAKITQEQAAQALGISRQTISNWENERSYPDIVSVLKMSDLYSVSLDYLLKGEGPMKDYLDYIEESTNTVKSKTRLSKLLLVLSYLVIWAFNIMASWRFSAGSITEAQAGGVQWLMLPAVTIILSLLIGKNNYWGKHKWLAPIGFGLMFMLSVYASYGMRESLNFNRVDLQTLSFFFIGMIASMIGLALGHALFADEKSKVKSK